MVIITTEIQLLLLLLLIRIRIEVEIEIVVSGCGIAVIEWSGLIIEHILLIVGIRSCVELVLLIIGEYVDRTEAILIGLVLLDHRSSCLKHCVIYIIYKFKTTSLIRPPSLHPPTIL